MKTLLILRHGKSSWKKPDLSDHDRPLNKRGKSDAPRMGRLLKEEDLVPDLILSSTAKRARKTAEKAAAASGYAGEVRPEEALYLAGPDAYIQLLKLVKDDCERVAVVGHNPGMEELLQTLTGVAEALPTAALAHVELPINRWRELNRDTRGKLVALWCPRELA